jgi:hypothetical protein
MIGQMHMPTKLYSSSLFFSYAHVFHSFTDSRLTPQMQTCYKLSKEGMVSLSLALSMLSLQITVLSLLESKLLTLLTILVCSSGIYLAGLSFSRSAYEPLS